MPRIDFYVLPDASPRGRHIFACRLAEKAVAQGLAVFVHTASREQSLMLDELMWTYKDISFLPHALSDDPQATAVPVVVGHDQRIQPDPPGLLINLDAAVPDFFERFERISELVDQSEAVKQDARQRFRFYKERGYTPQTHNL